jgi:hypothetical protein
LYTLTCLTESLYLGRFTGPAQAAIPLLAVGLVSLVCFPSGCHPVEPFI